MSYLGFHAIVEIRAQQLQRWAHGLNAQLYRTRVSLAPKAAKPAHRGVVMSSEACDDLSYPTDAAW